MNFESFIELSVFNTFETTGFEKLSISKNLEIAITKEKRIFTYRYILNNFFPRVSNEIKLISSAMKRILNYSYKFHQNTSIPYLLWEWEAFRNVSDFPNISEKSWKFLANISQRNSKSNEEIFMKFTKVGRYFKMLFTLLYSKFFLLLPSTDLRNKKVVETKLKSLVFPWAWECRILMFQ